AARASTIRRCAAPRPLMHRARAEPRTPKKSGEGARGRQGEGAKERQAMDAAYSCSSAFPHLPLSLSPPRPLSPLPLSARIFHLLQYAFVISIHQRGARMKKLVAALVCAAIVSVTARAQDYTAQAKAIMDRADVKRAFD